MPLLTHEKVILAFKKLSQSFVEPNEKMQNLIFSAQNSNAWFTSQMINKSLAAFAEMLNGDDLALWLKDIKIAEQPKKIGLILAGNIPLVGFHDVLSVLVTGNIALIKLSSSDDKLLPALLTILTEIEPAFKEHIIYVDRLKDFDAVIATGSNNSSRYFDYYFGKVPHIIRKNRNSVAVLSGKENKDDLDALSNDIFDYFGLGCRSVSKIYIPENYPIKHFFEGIENQSDIINHFKYNNNYDYNKSIYLVNRTEHYDNGFLLLKEDEALTSPLAVLYYETYNNVDDLAEKLNTQEENIQCVVSNIHLKLNKAAINFGQSQHPKLWDYADNTNTLAFLSNL